MSETSLKFGPEWLRALSHGNMSSPPSSPGPVKFKLAEYRYGRDQMLALYCKGVQSPDGLQNLGSLCIEQIQEPLAFIPINIDEQRIWQRVNSEQGLRGSGRAPINGMGRGRGSSGERGRGRGRGIGAPYYSRGISYDEESEARGAREGGPPGMPLRNKTYERSQSIGEGSRGWAGDRNAVERTTGVEERSGATSPLKGRAANENWRSRGSEEKGDNTWRGLRTDKWGNRGGWRERELADGEWEEGGRGQQPPGGRNSSRSWDSERDKEAQRRQWEEYNLPEWATENADDKGGSFDATGAFHAPGSSDECDDEDVDMEDLNNKQLKNGCGVTSDSGGSTVSKQHEEGRKKMNKALNEEKAAMNGSLKEALVEENKTRLKNPNIGQKIREREMMEEHSNHHIHESSSPPLSSSFTSQHSEAPVMNGVLSEEERIALRSSPSKRKDGKESLPISTIAPSSSSRIVPDTSTTPILASQDPVSLSMKTPTTIPHHSLPPNINPSLVHSSNSSLPVHHLHMERLEDKLQQREEDNLEHMQSAADDLVAKLVEDDEPRPPISDGRIRIHQPPPGVFLPSDHIPHPPPEDQWYYTDPQGDIQGPFSSVDMNAWFKAGYFKTTLLLRRECDDKFAHLGDLIKLYGRLPFTPGPPVPPLKVSELLSAQKAQAERERYELMQAQLLQKQLFHQQQQTSLRQQQQVLHSLQGMDDWSNLNSGQQQIFLQQIMTMPPIVPPTMPVSLHSTTVAAGATVNNTHHQSVVNQELRSSLPSSITPPLAQQAPDPIQAFVAQMATTVGSNHSTSSETSLSQPPQSNSPIGGEGPLQKLLLQLQRGSQSGVGGGLTTGGSSPLLPGHIPPSNLGTIPPSSMVLEKNPPDQYDAIQSLMSQLSKMQMQVPEPIQEDPRIREEEQKRIEDERRLFEEQKRAEEERMKLQELRLQEERLKEEKRRKELEAKNQRLEEELRKIQEEQVKRKREEEQQRRKKEQEEQEQRRKKKEDEQKAKEAENKRKMEQQKNAEAQKKEEEQKRQQQIKQKQKQEEEARKREEARKLEEAKKAEEEEQKRKEQQRIKEEQQQRIREEKKKEEEERRRKKEEKERQQQLQIQEEMRRIALEEERKRMLQLAEEERKKQVQHEEQAKQRQQKKGAASQEQKASQPAWNNTSTAQDKNNAPSLAEIQKTQEIKERKEREAEAQREAQRHKEAQRQAMEEKKKQEANLKWAARVSNKGNSKSAINQTPEVPVKSLIEIQKEEEKEMKKRKEKEQAERASTLSHLSLNAAGVWGSAAQSLSWANRASSGAASVAALSNAQQGSQQSWNSSNSMAWSTIAQSNVNNTSSGWNSETTMYNQNSSQNLGGFWESPDAVKYGSGKGQSTTATSASVRTPPKANTANQSSNAKSAAGVQAVNSNKMNKKKIKDENESVKKIFIYNITPADNFTQWCKSSLNSMKVHASIDIPTFVGFLADVESPYEVHDYIRSYLGDSKEVKEFAKQYLERRSKARNAQKERHDEDNILAPAPAINPSSNMEFQEVKTRLRKGRKKMQKVDSSILGFSVNALERVDVEDAN